MSPISLSLSHSLSRLLGLCRADETALLLLMRANLVRLFRRDDVSRLHTCLSRRGFLRPPSHSHSVTHSRTTSTSISTVALDALCVDLELDEHEHALLQPLMSFLVEEPDHCSFPMFSFYLWNLCTLDDSALARFAFGVLNPARSEVVCDRHMLALIKTLMNPNEIQQRAECMFEALSGVQHNAHTFSLFCKEFPFVTASLRQLQAKLRQGVLGASFWRRHTLTRATENQQGGRDRDDDEYDDDEAGLLRNIVTRFYQSNALSLVKSNSKGGNFLQNILQQYGLQHFLDAPFDIIQREISGASTVALSEVSGGGSEDRALPVVCKRCSHSFPTEHRHSHHLPASPSKVRATLLRRGGSLRELDDESSDSDEEKKKVTRPTLNRASSATVLMKQQQESDQGKCSIPKGGGMLHDHGEKYNGKNNIYCLQAQQFFRTRDENNCDMDQFWSCSSLSAPSADDEKGEQEQQEQHVEPICLPIRGRLGSGKRKKVVHGKAPRVMQVCDTKQHTTHHKVDLKAQSNESKKKSVSPFSRFTFGSVKGLLGMKSSRVLPLPQQDI
jgi:hypothetical protein